MQRKSSHHKPETRQSQTCPSWNLFPPSALCLRAEPHGTPEEHTLKIKNPHFKVREVRPEGEE